MSDEQTPFQRVAQILQENQSDTGESDNTDAPKTRKKRSAKQTATTSSFSATQIEGVHALIATYFNNPSLALTAQESEQLANALNDVAKEYEIVIDPKVAAWSKLFIVSATIYAPRAFIAYMSKQEGKKAPPTQQSWEDVLR